MSKKPNTTTGADEAPGEKPRAFVLIESKKEAEEFIREGVKSFASTIVWTKKQETSFNTYLTSMDIPAQEIYVWIPKEVHAETLHSSLLRSGDLNLYFSVSISRANVFFKAELVGVENGTFRVRFPKEVYKVQRRKDFRLPVPDGYTNYAEIPDPVIPDHRLRRKVIDISAGGMAVLGNLEDEALFKEGDVIKAVKFRVRMRDVTCDAQIRYMKSQLITSKQQGIKLGLQFQNLRNADIQHIAAYVFEESRKYLTKFM